MSAVIAIIDTRLLLLLLLHLLLLVLLMILLKDGRFRLKLVHTRLRLSSWECTLQVHITLTVRLTWMVQLHLSNVSVQGLPALLVRQSMVLFVELGCGCRESVALAMALVV